MPGTGPQPHGVTGFTINVATSDLDPVNGGITLKGTYTSNGHFDDSDYNIWVYEDGIATKLKGTIDFKSDGTFSFTASHNEAKKAGISNGDDVQFKLVFNNDTHTSSDDVLIGVSNVIHIVCYYPGTMIATPNGEVAIENLSINDMVLRHDGTAAPVRWIGRNTVSTLFSGKLKTLPIRIRKDALAENVPSRDLLVSPEHAILVDDILVQAGALVNDTSIVRETNVPSKFVYHHIELADHALVMAENTPAESFIDNVERRAYDNWAEHEALYGDLPALAEMDLPRAKSQRRVPPATRKRIADRAAALGYVAVAAA